MNAALAVLLLSLGQAHVESGPIEFRPSKEEVQAGRRHARFNVLLQQARCNLGVRESIVAEPLTSGIPDEYLARLGQLLGKKALKKWSPVAYINGSVRAGWTVYYDPAWLKKAKNGVVLWTAYHETCHAALDAERVSRGALNEDEWYDMERKAIGCANTWAGALLFAP
jgi:hypothetical protein